MKIVRKLFGRRGVLQNRSQWQRAADDLAPLDLLLVPHDVASLLPVRQAVVAPDVLHVVQVADLESMLLIIFGIYKQIFKSLNIAWLFSVTKSKTWVQLFTVHGSRIKFNA
jgi:hypothetical protein